VESDRQATPCYPFLVRLLGFLRLLLRPRAGLVEVQLLAHGTLVHVDNVQARGLKVRGGVVGGGDKDACRPSFGLYIGSTEMNVSSLDSRMSSAIFSSSSGLSMCGAGQCQTFVVALRMERMKGS
jgi:hypothetical protein